ncbi:DUF6688 family protein [Pedobacter agri]|uniref:DUF6688 domain-containing protein n=1 Tax=Pedobacter agri TaxID=454586 RepID=UPI002930DBA9|nr:DUF6688 family protein [Pedobacter agri]
MTIIFIIALLIFPFICWQIYNVTRKNVSIGAKVIEFLFITALVISVGLFCFAWIFNSDDYYKAIDIVDGGYSPFSLKHVPTLAVYFVLSMFSLVKLRFQGRAMPPLIFVLCVVFVVIGFPISLAIILQVSKIKADNSGMGILFAFLPFSYMISSIFVLLHTTLNEAKLASNRVYHNKILNYLNQKMATVSTQPLWVLLLLIPVFILITAILMLFGQHSNSITKVFTETTTWAFSQKTHPPFLDHKGHYLCTVAACGDPQIVKPIRLGKRYGYEIIVNRQLMVANAFEDLIQQYTPALHKVIRSFYNQYGYPLSKNITSAKGSNLIYILMKPIEYFFLIVLYLCCIEPEKRIAEQYSM